MASLIEVSFERATDSNGNPINGAKRKVLDAGTSNLSSVFTDAAGLISGANPIIADSAGIFPNRYLADGTYDVQYLNASDVPVGPTREDFVVSAAGGGGAGGDTYDVITKTANYSVSAADVLDKIPVFLVDASGIPGLEAIITIDAGTLGVDKAVIVINSGATGTVRVQPDTGSGETIDGGSEVVLTGLGSGRCFVCIGATGWQTISSTTVGVPSGGTTGQKLVKTSATNYDTSWVTDREVLTANRTYYVRTDGNNSNTGLVDSAGGAFLTIQKADDVVCGLDLNGFIVTVQVKDGTYTGSTTIRRKVGMTDAGGYIIQGNAGTPANVVISTTSANCFNVSDGALVTIKDMEMRTTTSGSQLFSENGALIKFTNLRFGICANRHMLAFGGDIKATGNYSVTGAATGHADAEPGGRIYITGITITFVGTPAITTGLLAFAAMIYAQSNSYVGTFTGADANAQVNGTIFGGTLFPGSGGTSVLTGGQIT